LELGIVTVAILWRRRRRAVLAALAVLCMCGGGLMPAGAPALAQSPGPQPAATVSVTGAAATAESLSRTVATQDAEIRDLKAAVAVAERIDDHEARLVRVEWVRDFAWAVLGFLGLATLGGFWAFSKLIHQMAEREFWKQMNLVDPRDLPLWVPGTSNFSEERKRLRLSQIRGLKEYTTLEEAGGSGAVVVPLGINADGKRDDAQAKEDEKRFLRYLESRPTRVDPAATAFILYSRPGYIIADETIGAFANTAVANMPTTLVSAVIAVARGLKRVP
jgi:hypothetical protein